MRYIANIIIGLFPLFFFSYAQGMELTQSMDKAHELYSRGSLLPDNDPRKMHALLGASRLGSVPAKFDLAMLDIKNAANQGYLPAQEILAKVGELNNDPEAAFVWHHAAHIPRRVKSVGFDLKKGTFYTKENNFSYKKRSSDQRKKVEKEQDSAAEQNTIIDEEDNKQLSSECNIDQLTKLQQLKDKVDNDRQASKDDIYQLISLLYNQEKYKNTISSKDMLLNYFEQAMCSAAQDNTLSDVHLAQKSGALPVVQHLADQGNARACYDFGMTLYHEGHKSNHDESYNVARTYLQKAADYGCSDAYWYLAHMHICGYGGKVSILDAFECFEKAEQASDDSTLFSSFNKRCHETTINILTSHAQAGDIHAGYILARLWYERKSNLADAYNYFKQIADQQHALAQWYVGDMLLQGQGVEQSVDDASRYFHRAALQENVAKRSINQRAQMYAFASLTTLSDEGNIHANYYLIHVALSNKQTDKQSIKEMLQLADRIEEKAQKNNDEKTLKAFVATGAYSAIKEHADTNNPDACSLLGLIHIARGHNQRGLILENNDPKGEIKTGIGYLKRALKYGDPDKEGIKNALAKEELYIGDLYQEEQNISVACEWYERAAARGNVIAKFKLGKQWLKDLTKSPEKGKKGFALLKEVAEAGNVYAQNTVGSIYYSGYRGLDVEPDYEQAYCFLRKARDQGSNDPYVCSVLGRLLYDHGGKGSIPNDPQEAQTLLQIAADGGNDDATYYVGRMHYNDKEYDKAYACFDKISASNHFACWHLGMMYLNGLGVKKELDKAFEHFTAVQNNVQGDMFRDLCALTNDDTFNTLKELAEQQDLRACYLFGKLCFNRDDEPARNNRQQAFGALCFAADNGHASAQFSVGAMYGLGKDVEQSMDKAFQRLIQVLNNNNVDKRTSGHALLSLENFAGQGHLAVCYYLVPYLIKQGEQKTIEKAFRFFGNIINSVKLPAEIDSLMTSDAFKAVKELADNGNSEASYCIGAVFCRRSNIYKNEWANNLDKSIRYLERAGKTEKSKKLLQEVYTRCIRLYEQAGQQEKALSHCRKAIELGSVGARAWLGWTYLNGRMSDTSSKEALKRGVKLLKQAAGRNSPDAQLILGRLYSYGPDKKCGCGETFKYKDMQRAEEYFQAAAKQGSSNAQYELGSLLYNQKKYAQAVDPFKQSAVQRNFRACVLLGILYLDDNGVKQDYKSAVHYLIDSIRYGALVKGKYVDRFIAAAFKKALCQLIIGAKNDAKVSKLLDIVFGCLKQHGQKYGHSVDKEGNIGIYYQNEQGVCCL